MPDQNQSDPTQDPVTPVNPPVTPSPTQQTDSSTVVPPVISPQADLPPLPPEFQNIPEESDPTSQQTSVSTGTPTGSAAPADDNLPPVTSTPKKKFGGGRIIATILGLVVLVGGVGAGILLTQQKQLIQQKASSETCSNDANTVINCRGKEPGYEFCFYGSDMICIAPSGTLLGCGQVEGGHACSTGGGGGTSWPPNGTSCSSTGGVPGTIEGCVTYFCPNGCSGTCGESNAGVYSSYYGTCSAADSALGSYCGQVDTVNTNHAYCMPSGYKDTKIQCSGCTNPPPRTTEPTPVPTPTPTPTPVPTPPSAPSCVSVKAYNSEWNLLTQTQLSSLTAGAVVNFCVAGSTTTGTFDKAQFKIGTTTQEVITTKRTGSSDFCQSYTILATDTTITVLAKIHDLVTNTWVGESF